VTRLTCRIRPLGEKRIKSADSIATNSCPDTLRDFRPGHPLATCLPQPMAPPRGRAPPNPETFCFLEPGAADGRVPSYRIILKSFIARPPSLVVFVHNCNSRQWYHRAASLSATLPLASVVVAHGPKQPGARGSRGPATSNARRSRSRRATAGGRRTCSSGDLYLYISNSHRLTLSAAHGQEGNFGRFHFGEQQHR